MSVTEIETPDSIVMSPVLDMLTEYFFDVSEDACAEWVRLDPLLKTTFPPMDTGLSNTIAAPLRASKPEFTVRLAPAVNVKLYVPG